MDVITTVMAIGLAGIAAYNIRRADRAEAALAAVEQVIRECEDQVCVIVSDDARRVGAEPGNP